jgi:hypothetical protein
MHFHPGCHLTNGTQDLFTRRENSLRLKRNNSRAQSRDIKMLAFSFRIHFYRCMTRFHFQERQLDENQLLDIIFAKNEKNRDNAFWSELSECDGIAQYSF